VEEDTVAVPNLDTVTGPVPVQVPPNTVPAPVQPVPDDNDSTSSDDEVVVQPIVEPVGRTRRGTGKNKRFFGEEWVNYQTGSSSTGSNQKIRAGVLDRQYIQSLDWNKTLDVIRSRDLAHYNLDDETVEWVHPTP
jgi:hypothetical protein